MARTFVKGSDIASLTIQTGNIANLAISEGKLADSAVTSIKINDGAIIAAKLGAGAVETAKLADGAVTLAKMGANSVDAGKIVDGAVGTDELAALSVTTGKLVDEAVTSAKIGAGQVLTTKLADGAVEPGKANLSATWTFADLRGTLGADLNANSKKIVSLAEPGAASDAATKGYVDSVAQGLDVKASCAAIARTNITLSGTQTIDGVSLVAGDRVLVSAQTNAVQNGIYVVAAGAWARSADMAASSNAAAAFTFVERGSDNADSGWVCTSDAATVGTDPLAFSQFSGAGQIEAGAGLTKTGNRLDVVGGNGLNVSADAVAVKLAAVNPALAFDGGGGLQVILNGSATGTFAKAIDSAAGGLSIKVDDASIEGDQTPGASLGRLRIKENGVTSAKLAAGAVIEAKIADNAVTTGKINNGAVTMDKLDSTVKGAIGKFDFYQAGAFSGSAPFSVSLSNTPQTDSAALLVFVNGVMRMKSLDYSLSGSTVTFDNAVGTAGDDYAIYYGVA